MTGKVYFIGAGPGDPELITVKGKRIIDDADIIVYADSLVNPALFDSARQGVEIHGSASLTLEEITGILSKAAREGKTVARVHTGDPSIYGAIREQMVLLDEEGIDYEVIPGVSSLFGSTAALKAELTVPEVAQTVIITRMEGRTPVPEAENLRGLAAHQASIAVFLSASLLKKVVNELIAGGYPADTPAALVYRATWPDEQIIRCALEELAVEAEKVGIRKQAMILVGKFLEADDSSRSRLYHDSFKHEYR